MVEGKWNRTLRSAFAGWSVLSAMGGSLITAYKFLSDHGEIAPAGAAGAGVVAIVVNACLFTATLFFNGVLIGVFFAYLVRKDAPMPTILKIVCLLFVGVVLLFLSSGIDFGLRVFGALCLLCVVLRLSPMAGWVEQHDTETILGAGSILMIIFSMIPGFTQSLWRTLTERRDFTMVPLSSMTFSLWFFAVLGAVLYAWGYFEFQDWRARKN